MLNVLLEASKHEWLQDHMQALQLMLVKLSLVHAVLLDVLGEPLLKLLVIIEELRHDEVKQCPQLSHRVLNWCTRQQQPITSLEAK